MKDFIMVAALIILGVSLFVMISGPGENSIKSNLTKVWQHEIEQQSEIYP